jgi:hypothetical protein
VLPRQAHGGEFANLLVRPHNMNNVKIFITVTLTAITVITVISSTILNKGYTYYICDNITKVNGILFKATGSRIEIKAITLP